MGRLLTGMFSTFGRYGRLQSKHSFECSPDMGANVLVSDPSTVIMQGEDLCHGVGRRSNKLRRVLWSMLVSATAFIGGYTNAADYTADLENIRSKSRNTYNNLRSFQQTEFPSIDTSNTQEMAKYGYHPDVHADANRLKIQECTQAANDNYAELTEEKKIECQAIVTASGNLRSPNPYLDLNNPDNQAEEFKQLESTTRQRSQAQFGVSAESYSNSIVSSRSTCKRERVKLPPLHRDETCPVEKPHLPVWCDSAVTVSAREDAPFPTEVTFQTLTCDRTEAMWSPESPGDALEQTDTFCGAVAFGGYYGDESVSVVKNADACRPYDEDPFMEPGRVLDDDPRSRVNEPCVQKALYQIRIDKNNDGDYDDLEDDTKTQEICTLWRKGYTKWDVAAPWEEENCEVLEQNRTCTWPQGEYGFTKWIGEFPVQGTRRYRCTFQPEVEVDQGESCQTSMCVGETCMDTTVTKNADFAKAAVGLEMLREGGVYSHVPDGPPCPDYIRAYLDSCESLGDCSSSQTYLSMYPQCGRNEGCPSGIMAFMETCKTEQGCDPVRFEEYIDEYPVCYPVGMTCPDYLRQFLEGCESDISCDESLRDEYLAQYPGCRYAPPKGGTPDKLRLFAGVSDNCSYPVGPAKIIGKNCCSSSDVDLKSNRKVLPSIAWDVGLSAAMSGGSYGARQASNYMFDWMFNDGGEWMVDAASNAWSSGWWDPGAGFNMSVSVYGFTLSSGVAGTGGFLTKFIPADSVLGQGLSFVNAGNMTLAKDLLGSGLDLTFNPYILAAQIALQIIMDLRSCTLDEQMLSARKGGNLCFMTREWCSKKIPIVKTCIRRTQTWCCLNSRLAKEVAIQGSQQMGINPPRCDGFTPEEISNLNFASIDLSGFQSEVLANTAIPDLMYHAKAGQVAVDRSEDALNNPSCTDPARCGVPIDDSGCGTSHLAEVIPPPTGTAACKVGSPMQMSVSNLRYTWNCTSATGGTSQCSASRIGVSTELCGSASIEKGNQTINATAPTSLLCKDVNQNPSVSVGTDQNKKFTWTCPATEEHPTDVICTARHGYEVVGYATGAWVNDKPQMIEHGTTASFLFTPYPNMTGSIQGCGGNALSGVEVATTFITGRITAPCTVTGTFAERQNPTTDPGFGLWIPPGFVGTPLSESTLLVADHSGAPPHSANSYLPGCLNGARAQVGEGCAFSTSYTGTPYGMSEPYTFSFKQNRVLSLRYKPNAGAGSSIRWIYLKSDDGGSNLPAQVQLWITTDPTVSFENTSPACKQNGNSSVFVNTGPGACPLSDRQPIYYVNIQQMFTDQSNVYHLYTQVDDFQ